MSHIYSSQFSRQLRDMIALGAVDGWRVIHKFGANYDLGTAVEDVWAAGGIYSYLTAAASIEVLSSSAADTATAGAGARTVFIEGLGDGFVEQSETVQMDGVTPVALTLDYLRVNRAYVLSTGTYGTGSSGDITIRVAGAGATQARIERTSVDAIAWDYGQTEIGRYTVPASRTAFISRMQFQVEDAKRADFAIFTRVDGNLLAAPYASRRVIASKPGVTGEVTINFDAPLIMTAKTDLIIQARLSNGANGRVAAIYEIFEGVV